MDVLLGEGGRQLPFATTVLLAGALCVHSVLEGMALGAQQSMANTENIMIAIAGACVCACACVCVCVSVCVCVCARARTHKFARL